MTPRESIFGAISVVIAVVLASACAISNGTLAPVLATGAGLLPMLWVFGHGGRPRARAAKPASVSPRVAPRRLGSVDDRGRAPIAELILVPDRELTGRALHRAAPLDASRRADRVIQ